MDVLATESPKTHHHIITQKLHIQVRCLRNDNYVHRTCLLDILSSIGMAKAALEAVNGCNLFGEHGAAWSVIFVDIDAHNRNRTIFETILPRESNSKVRGTNDDFLL